MSANRRFTASVLLAVSLGAAATVAGCGGSPPAATSVAPPGPKTPKIPASELQKSATCMKSQGVTFSTAKVTGKDVKETFRSLPVGRQQSVFRACGSALPASIRLVIQQRMARETAGAAPGTTASP